MNQFEFVYLIIFITVSFFYLYELGLIFISHLIKHEDYIQNEKLYSFIILIPAYKESHTLILTSESITNLNYPAVKFKSILIADECDENVLKAIPPQIEILRISLSQHTKINSLKQAINSIDEYDYVVILDADNLPHPDFLKNLNNKLDDKKLVIQGLRLPKNLQNRTAKLDAITDFVYNRLDRIIPMKLGLTGTLSGSGFAMEKNLFRELIASINTFGGFDKILQSKLLLRNIPIYIAIDAIIYDEKTSKQSTYITQRKRWLYYHFYNSLKFGFKLVSRGLTNFNINQFHSGIISLRLPLNLLFFISIILIVLGFWFNAIYSIIMSILVLGLLTYILKILKDSNILTFELLFSLPIIFINHFFSYFGMMKAKSNSLKTEHNMEDSN